MRSKERARSVCTCVYKEFMGKGFDGYAGWICRAPEGRLPRAVFGESCQAELLSLSGGSLRSLAVQGGPPVNGG